MSPDRTFTMLSALLLGLVTGACSSDDSPGDPRAWVAVQDTIGDTVVVRTVSGSVWGDTATLVPEVSIGMLEGPEEYSFGQVYSLALGHDGTILAVDRPDQASQGQLELPLRLAGAQLERGLQEQARLALR